MAFKVPDAVAAALIGALAAISVALIDKLPNNPEPPGPIEGKPISTPSVTAKLDLDSTQSDSRCAAMIQKFGDWRDTYEDNGALRNYQKGQVYIAAEDGFVSAISGGNTPSTGVVIRVRNAGESGNNKDTFRMRFRSRVQYAGGVVPIAKGQQWFVTHSDGDGKISISWAPVRYVRARPDGSECS